VQCVCPALAGPQQGGLRDGEVPVGGPGPRDRVQHTVDHDCPDAVREHVRVDVAEIGAVGEPEIGELLVPHRPAQDVHVAGILGGGHRRHQRPAGGGAGLAERAGRLDVGVLLARRPRERDVEGIQHGALRAGVLPAARVVAGPDSTGVDADDVEAREHVGSEEERRLGRHLDAGGARAAGVHEERPELVLLVGRLDAKHRHRGLRPVRVVVVQGQVHGRALVTGVEDAAAVEPVRLRRGHPVDPASLERAGGVARHCLRGARRSSRRREWKPQKSRCQDRWDQAERPHGSHL
jgi:hypothetical protein